MQPFHLILGNSLLQNVTNFTVWFGLLFWAFIETHSVFVTGLVGGVYMVITACLAVWFGNLVDSHRKRDLMIASSGASLMFYIIAYGVLYATPGPNMSNENGWPLWVFITLVIGGVAAGNLRMIALPTLVTALVPDDKRGNTNGLVGMVNGAGLVVTSAISGYLVAWDGMVAILLFGISLSILAAIHLKTLAFVEPHSPGRVPGPRKWLDLHETIMTISTVKGLSTLIVLSAFNNLLGGVFMALIDAYGLSLMHVKEWGMLWAGASVGFVVSGLVIARIGVGRNPVKTLLVANAFLWAVASVFTLKSSVIMLGVGCLIYLFLYPFVEAAEQTALQGLVPYDRQGRVFGFAQSVEQMAAPMTSFLVGPLTQFVVIPFMSTGRGAHTIGRLYGAGPDRGMALMFTLTGIIGLAGAIVALNSRFYRDISETYRNDRAGS